MGASESEQTLESIIEDLETSRPEQGTETEKNEIEEKAASMSADEKIQLLSNEEDFAIAAQRFRSTYKMLNDLVTDETIASVGEDVEIFEELGREKDTFEDRYFEGETESWNVHTIMLDILDQNDEGITPSGLTNEMAHMGDNDKGGLLHEYSDLMQDFADERDLGPLNPEISNEQIYNQIIDLTEKIGDAEDTTVFAELASIRTSIRNLENNSDYEFSDDEINNIANYIVDNIDDGAIEVNSEPYVDGDTLKAAFNDADIEVNAEADLDEDDYDEIADRVVDRIDVPDPDYEPGTDEPGGDDPDGPGEDEPEDDDGYTCTKRDILTVGAAGGAAYVGATKGGFIGGLVGALLGSETGNNSGKTPVNGGNGYGGDGQVDGLRTGVWVDWETADDCLSRHNEDVIRKNLVQEGQYDSLDELEYMFTEDGSEYDVRFRDGSGNIIKAKYDNQDLTCEVE